MVEVAWIAVFKAQPCTQLKWWFFENTSTDAVAKFSYRRDDAIYGSSEGFAIFRHCSAEILPTVEAGIMSTLRMRKLAMKGLATVLCFGSFICFAVELRRLQAQSDNRRTEVIPAAMKQLSAGDSAPVFIQCLVDLNASEAIPLLKARYATLHIDPMATSDSEVVREADKGKIASALVALGVLDSTYWDYLLERATIAVERGYPAFLNEQTSIAREQFIESAQSQDLSPEMLASEMSYGDPGAVSFLAETNDLRSLPVLKRAMKAKSPHVRLIAAEELTNFATEDQSLSSSRLSMIR